MVPPHRIAIGGSGSAPNTRSSAVIVRCRVPSPPCTAMTAGPRLAELARQLVQLIQRLGGVDAALIADDRLELGGNARDCGGSRASAG